MMFLHVPKLGDDDVPDHVDALRDATLRLSRALWPALPVPSLKIGSVATHASVVVAPLGAQDLLNLMSHGLATPLTSMGLQIHMLRAGDAPTARQERILGILERNYACLQEHVSDVATAARLIAAPPRANEGVIDLAAMLLEAVRVEAPNADQRRIHVSVEPTLSHVRADPTVLAETVRRLVHHATGASRAGGRVSIATSEDATSVTLRFTDAGGRVSDDESATLFDVDAPDTARPPAGFGLFIAAGLARIAGAEIAHEHTPDGMAIVLRLPRAV